MGRLKDRIALVIGGSGGIGGAIARGFAAEGARLAIAGRTPAKVEAAVSVLRATGATATAHPRDLAGPEDCRALVDAVVAEHGRIHVLVNSQGTTVFKPAADVSGEDYDRVLDLNLRSVFFTCQATHRHMRGHGGAIVNIASLAAHRGWPLAAAYAASKHGVVALTKTFACEWAKDGVRVNAISPGFFMTDLNRRRMKPERKAAAVARTPLGRFGEIDELVGAAVYLASEEARFVTGVDLAVDGGYLAQGI